MTRAAIAAAAAAGTVAAAWWLSRAGGQLVDAQQLELEPEPETDFTAPLAGAYGWTMEQIDPTNEQQAQANVQAFLRTIRVAEGTADADGYRALFGHRPSRPRLFDSFADHPRVATRFTDRAGRVLYTSAAGAYQFMAVSPIPFTDRKTKVDTWDRLQRKLGPALPDFSPASQDRAAVELLLEAGALYAVRAGRFAAAIDKVRRIWASLPGAGYDQAERSLQSLQLAFINAGGEVSA